jgi:hypothetical protein
VTTQPIVTGVPYVPLPGVGAVVRFTTQPRDARPGALFIVAGYNRRGDGVRLEYLGGHPNGVYYRNVRPAHFEVLTLEDAARHILSHAEVTP